MQVAWVVHLWGSTIQAGSVGRFGPLQFGGPRCRWPLAENHQGRYRERASVLAWRHPFLAGIFWESTSFYQKSAETTTLFVKRTTKAVRNRRRIPRGRSERDARTRDRGSLGGKPQPIRRVRV